MKNTNNLSCLSKLHNHIGMFLIILFASWLFWQMMYSPCHNASAVEYSEPILLRKPVTSTNSYCQKGVKNGWCTSKNFKTMCEKECNTTIKTPFRRYNSRFSYPSHNKSTDNYYNYCNWGAKQGWCNVNEFKNICRNECP